jgi:hypothetical protein
MEGLLAADAIKIKTPPPGCALTGSRERLFTEYISTFWEGVIAKQISDIRTMAVAA